MKVSADSASYDAELYERAKAFDADALTAIYDRYESKIYSYVYHRVGDPNVAQDLTSQVFLRMLEAIQNEQAWRSSFSGWLYRIAHNLVVDFYRRRGRTGQSSLEDLGLLVASSEDPLQAAERTLAGERLRATINLLTEEQAQVVTLRFLEELSVAEVAATMGKSEGAIKALQYRAVVRLRSLLDHQALGE